jgi:hypothetical protein
MKPKIFIVSLSFFLLSYLAHCQLSDSIMHQKRPVQHWCMLYLLPTPSVTLCSEVGDLHDSIYIMSDPIWVSVQNWHINTTYRQTYSQEDIKEMGTWNFPYIWH